MQRFLKSAFKSGDQKMGELTDKSDGIAQQHLASADADDLPEAQRRLDLILRNAGDRFYDIKCPQGHYTLKAAPQITKAIRTTAGDQVTLS